MVLEKTLENPLDWKEIKPINPKGNQSWIFISRTDAEAETPIVWPPDGTNWLTGKDPDAGKDWRQEENRMTEDELAGWHQRLNGHEFEQVPGLGDGQGGLACCGSWGCRVGHNWATSLSLSFFVCDIHLILNMSKTELSSAWKLFVLLVPILSTDATSYPASQAENLDVSLC